MLHPRAGRCIVGIFAASRTHFHKESQAKELCHVPSRPRTRSVPAPLLPLPAPPRPSRRRLPGGLFLGGAALGGVALTGLSWSVLAAAEPELPTPPRRGGPLRGQADLHLRHLQAAPADELADLGRHRDPGGRRRGSGAHQGRTGQAQGRRPISRSSSCPWPPCRSGRRRRGRRRTSPTADVLLVYAAGGDMDCSTRRRRLGKDTIFFVRHKSGPGLPLVRDHQPALPAPAHRHAGRQGHRRSTTWWSTARTRSSGGCGRCAGCATRSARKILAIGGPGGWAQPGDVVPTWSQEALEARHPDRHLRRAGQADQGRPAPTRRPWPWPSRAGRGLPEAARHHAGNRDGSSSTTPSCWSRSSAG